VTVPTFDQLRERGYSSLAVAISTNYPGGYRGLRRFVEGTENKPSGYWQDRGNFDREYDEACKELGHSPTAKELRYSGRHSVSTVARKHYGGLDGVRENRNQKHVQKPRGYWKKWKNLENELKHIIEEIGHFPTQRECYDLGRSSVHAAIGNFGGVAKVKKRLGYEDKGKVAKAPNYWKRWSNVESGVGRMFNEHPELKGKFPTQKWMNDNGHTALLSGILAYHSGTNAVRERLGLERNTHNDKSVYASEAGLRRGLEALWEEHPEKRGTLPADSWLRGNGYKALSTSVYKHHDGFVNARNKLRLGSSGKKKHKYRRGSLKDWGKFRKAVGELMEEYPKLEGNLPSPTWLRDHGYAGIVSTASKYHGGLVAVRKRLGHATLRRDNGKLKDFDYVREEVARLISENPELNGECPHYTWFQRNGQSSLHSAISTHHGGLAVFREIFGGEQETKPDGYWNSWENIRDELLEVISTHEELDGSLPSSHWLRNNGHLDIEAAIQRSEWSYGEVRRMFEEEMGIERRRKKELEGILLEYVSGGSE
jgi:hypothetical protein